MIIALSGLAGSGKSTVKNLLAEKLGIKKYSAGDLRGKMALERGMTIDELNTLGMQESFTDKEVDDFQANLGKTEDNFVIDGWLSWHFIPHAKKIFLTVDPTVGAQRIFAARQHETDREDEPEYASLEATQEVLAARTANNSARYQKWYGVDFNDLSHYDLVIDTSHITPAEVVQKIEEFIHS
jgi:predicted cytidylate kinase